MNERHILKAFLLGSLHSMFSHLLIRNQPYPENDDKEWYMMDNKIIQSLIHGIVETGDYTLEGIACYTNLPFEVVFDAACGNNKQFSIAPWAKIIDLYIQVKPEIAKMVFSKLAEVINNNVGNLSLLLRE